MRSTVHIFILCISAINFIHASCPNRCHGRGVCDKFSRCSCSDGYQGADCSEHICPFGLAWSDEAISIDNAHNSAECSNRGICERSSGKCKCMPGFTGSACERLDCFRSCSGRGICYKMEDFALRTRSAMSESFRYDVAWDSDKIKGCHCDDGSYGYDCSRKVCPDGDDPLTTGQVNEVQLISCVGNTGSFVLYYEGVPSATIAHNAAPLAVKNAILAIPAITDVKVTFSQPSGTACQVEPNVIVIEFTEQFGALHPLVPYLDPVLTDSGGFITVSADGDRVLQDKSGRKYKSVKGTKEADVCANRGICDPDEGVCKCYNYNGDAYGSSNGYGSAGTRGDCGYVVSATTNTVSTCPGEIACSGHGVCNTDTFRCSCSAGWTSGDCSEQFCPSGLSWFSYPTADNQAHNVYEECSNMGHCDRATGQCQCRPSFYGEACQYMSCGFDGGTDEGAPATCSGHGRCMSMAELALWANNNGDAAPYVYGSDVNNFLTWDYNRVHGCLCDTGFSGYDCSLADCPVGDDPGTYDDQVEVQLLRCVADSGNFTVSFRQASTPPLSYNITATDFQRALAQLSTIKYGKVRVFFAYDGLPPNGTFNKVKPLKTLPAGFPPWATLVNDTYMQQLANTTVSGVFPFRDSNFCRTDGTQIAIVVFDGTHGDVPALQFDRRGLLDFTNHNGEPYSGRVSVYGDGAEVYGLKSVRGTTETAVCNNRGLCDIATGQCKCFPDWTSSDGTRQGTAGFTNDCGYRNDMRFSAFALGANPKMHS